MNSRGLCGRVPLSRLYWPCATPTPSKKNKNPAFLPYCVTRQLGALEVTDCRPLVATVRSLRGQSAFLHLPTVSHLCWLPRACMMPRNAHYWAEALSPYCRSSSCSAGRADTETSLSPSRSCLTPASHSNTRDQWARRTLFATCFGCQCGGCLGKGIEGGRGRNLA